MIENEFNLPSIPEILEEKEYKHRTKYRSLYIRLIKRGLSMTEKELNGYNEKHHILPRCMGGDDNKENLVLLPVRYHIMAHIILLEAYPDHTGICYAAFCMINGFKPKRDLSIQKHFSTRLIAKTREKSKSNLHLSEEQKALISKRNKGRKLTPEQLKTWSEVKKGDRNYWFGKNIPEKTKQKISKKVKKLWEDNHDSMASCFLKRGESPHAKKIVGPDGTIYDCLLDAVEASGIPSTTLRSWMKGITKKTKNVNLKGWHYLNPEDALTRKQKKKD